MEHKFIKFENGSFNATHIASLKLEDFLKENENHVQFATLTAEARKEKLTAIYKACVEAVKEPAPAAAAEAIQAAPTTPAKPGQEAQPEAKK